MKVYISGALQGASHLAMAKELYENAAAAVVASGNVAYLPHTQTDPVEHSARSAAQVYETDLHQLAASDVVLAFVDYPSLGVGAEIAIALHRNLPVIALREKGRQVSRFVEGLLSANGYGVADYEGRASLREIVPELLSKLDDGNADWNSVRAAE
ncbi:MAG: nucleoside 2-deoxyribosyltransferase [Fimbriimonadaceae bacterium]